MNDATWILIGIFICLLLARRFRISRQHERNIKRARQDYIDDCNHTYYERMTIMGYEVERPRLTRRK
jgi:hypothetical protein